MSTPQSCLVVEDHIQAQKWLNEAVARAFPTARLTNAISIADVRTQLINNQKFDLVLLDIGLPDGNGLDLVGTLSNLGSTVVITTVYDDDEYLFDALKFGAKGYLLKDHDLDQIVLMLEGVLDGKPPLSPRIAQRILEFFTAQTIPKEDVRQATNPEELLTQRERDVLTMLAKGFTIPATAEVLEISPHTVQGHTKNIYKKLNVTSRAEATLEAQRFGLVKLD